MREVKRKKKRKTEKRKDRNTARTESNRGYSKMKKDNVKKSPEKSKNVLEKRKMVEGKIASKSPTRIQ